jgi:hypothetical protein
MLALSTIGQIRLTRGDSLDLPVTINQGTSMEPIKYDLREYDEVYFALMEPNQPWENAILKQKYTIEDLIDDELYIRFKPKDTMCLIPGLYYYQIKIRIYDYDSEEYVVNTIVPKTHFWIEE